MKEVNGFKVYEGSDICALDEYSEQMANDLGTKFNEISKEQTTQNNKLNSIETKNINQDNLIQQLQQENTLLKSQIPTGTASGEEITLTDSSNMPFNNFIVQGKSEQKQYEGYNLLNINNEKSNLFSATKVINGNTIKISSTEQATTSRMEIPVDYEINTDYTVKFHYKYIQGAGNGYNSIVYMRKTSPLILSNGVKIDSEEGNGIFNFNLTETGLTLWLYIKASSLEGIATIEFSDIQIVKGTYTLENFPSYEPYVGGQPSPSPEFPSRIKNVGDDINLFKTEKWNLCSIYNGYPILNESLTDITIKDSNSNNVEFDTTATYMGVVSDFVEVKEGQELTVSFEQENVNRFYIMQYDINKQFIKNLNKTAEIKNTTVIIENNGYIAIGFSNTVATLNCKVYKIKIKEGTVATAYSPYGCGSVVIEQRGVNIWNEKWELGSLNTTTGEKTSTSACIRSTDYIPLKPNTTYYFKTAYSEMCFYDKDKKFISSTAKANQTFTTDTNTRYLLFRNAIAYGTTYNNDIIIAESDTEVQYEPHQSETFIFPLAEGQVLHEGDYLAEDGIHSNRKTIVLDGSEPWILESTLTNTINFYTRKYNDVPYKSNCLSNYFIKGSYGVDKEHIVCTPFETSMISIYISKERLSSISIDAFKTWLSNNPVTLEYELAEEIVTPYTEAQKEVMDKIENSHTYKNITHISAKGDIKPTLEVEYYRDLNTILNNIANAFIASGGGVNV